MPSSVTLRLILQSIFLLLPLHLRQRNDVEKLSIMNYLEKMTEVFMEPTEIVTMWLLILFGYMVHQMGVDTSKATFVS